MTFSAIIFTLLSSFSWAALDAVRKSLSHSIKPIQLTLILSVGQIPLFFIWYLFAGALPTEVDYYLPALVSTILAIVGAMLYILSVRYTPLSHSIPFLSLTPAFTALASPLIGEYASYQQIVGILLIVLGGLFLHPPLTVAEKSFSLIVRAKILFREKGSLIMCGAAFFWGLAPLFDKVALTYAAPVTHGLFLAVTGSLMLWGYMFYKQEIIVTQAIYSRKYALLTGVFLLGLALALQLFAIQLIEVSTFEAVKRSLAIASSVIVGRMLFKEQMHLRKILCCALMVIGVLLVLS